MANGDKMSRTFINQLSDGTKLDEVFLASEKQLRPNRQGQLYLQLRIADKTGSVTAMKWNAEQSDYDAINNGDYVRVQGNSQVYNGAVQVIARSVATVERETINEADFVTMDIKAIEELTIRLTGLLRSFSDPQLANLAEAYLIDEEFMRKFKSAPAGIKHHHAYRGGLLRHVVDLMETARFVGDKYPELNGDLLVFGAFIHDSGKVDELYYERELGYSDSGQLIGHMVMGVEILTIKIKEAAQLASESAVSPELQTKLKHMIMSHHGEAEFGSPVLPMTLEAITLHLLDCLDARLAAVNQMIDDDVNQDSKWTVYNPAMQRKIYKSKD